MIGESAGPAVGPAGRTGLRGQSTMGTAVACHPEDAVTQPPPNISHVSYRRGRIQQDHGLHILRVAGIGVHFPAGELAREVQIADETESGIAFLVSRIECAYGKR